VRVALVLLAGCLDIHDFHAAGVDASGGDGGGDGPPASCTETSPGVQLGWPVGSITFGSTAADTELTGSGWKLSFTSGAMHFPFSYQLANRELLAANAGSCFDASLTGVSIAPGGRSDSGSVGSANLVQVVAGPDIWSYRIDWQANLGCRTAKIASTWTMFPDGRIARHDSLTDPQPLGGLCACTQTSPTGVPVQAETLYASTAIDTVRQADGSQIVQSASADGGIPAAVCLTGPVAATLVSLGGPGSTGKLYSKMTNANIGLAYHFFDGTPLADAEGTSSYVPVASGVPCGDAIAALAGFTQGVMVAVDDQVLPLARARDGVFGEIATGVDVHDTASITVPSGVAAPPGFAIGLHFIQGARTHYAVARNGVPLDADHARVQYVDDRHAILWLRESFGGANAPCDRIAITAMP